MSKRYVMRLSYIGNSYRGSQKQVTANVLDIDSIQGAVECSLYRIRPALVERPTIMLAGRTDAGVHALNTAAHVDLELKPTMKNPLETDTILRLMNRFLIHGGHDIRIFSLHQVSKDFHARFSAKSRSYLYRFIVAKNPDDHKIPIAESGRSLHLRLDKFDIDKMKKGLDLFRGKKDFRSFCTKTINKNDKEPWKRSFVKTLDIRLEESTPLMPFDPLSKNFNYYHLCFTSKSFLYNQIRRIVGALIALGASRVKEEHIITMLQVPSHNYWHPMMIPAHPHGLYLANVEYDENDIREMSD